jgi:hypothetical protein
MPRFGHRLALGLFAGVIAAWLVVMAVVMRHAALPAEASGPMIAVFEPGVSADDVFAKLTQAGARPVRATGFDFIWIVVGDEPGLAGRLAQQGAVGAYKELPFSPTLAGCVALADVKIAQYTGL